MLLPKLTPGPTCGEEPALGCTVFTLSKGDQVFFGGNDDYINPDSYYWVDPGREGEYGAIWIGTPDNVQQGVNEMGLAYDANGLPRVDTNPHPEREPVAGGYTSYPIQILRENATVAEVVDWVQRHQWHSFMHDQLQFADAGGDGVIISAGPDGELVYTRKPTGDGFLVSTNYNVADPGNGFGYPCWRYEAAQRMLNQLVARPGDLVPADVAAVLDTVHVDGGTSWTIASLLADLPRGKVYLYYFHQFDHPLVLDVAEELASPTEPGPLSRLFPEKVQREAGRRYEEIQSRSGRCQWIGLFWFGVTAASLTALLFLAGSRRRGLVFWLLVVTTLGPLGLLIWGLGGRKTDAGIGRLGLVEAAGDVVPTAVAFVTLLIVVALVPQAQSPGLLQVALILGLPFSMGLLFHGALLSSAANMGFLQLVRRRFPHVVVAMTLGLAGINTIAVPLVGLSTKACAILPLPAGTVGVFWAIIASGSVAGGSLLWIYGRWAAGRGFRAWTALVSGEIEPSFAGWRRIWWWIPLGLVALAGSVLVIAYLQRLLQG